MTQGAFADKGIREVPEYGPKANSQPTEETEIIGAEHGRITFSFCLPNSQDFRPEEVGNF